MPEQYQVSGKSADAISESIESGVREGRIDIGSSLPAIRLLAQTLQVSPATVAKAYADLQRRGVVEAAGRRGTRVRRRPPVDGTRAGLRLPVPEGVSDLTDGEPSPALLPPLGYDLVRLGERLGPPLGYASAGAMPELVDAAGYRLAHDGVPVAGAAITVTSGTLDAIERLLMAHLRPGDAVAVEDPGWSNLFDLLAALGLRAVPVRVDDKGMLPVPLEAALEAGVRAVVITNRAQNPTGAALTGHRAARLRDTLSTRRHDLLLIEDDHAAELSSAPLHCLGPVTAHWAFIRSASKPYGPDLRIALLAGDDVTIARVAGRMRIGSGWVSTILQRLLLRLWDDPAVGAIVDKAARHYDARRREVVDTLADHGLPAQGTTGINVWVPVADETRAVGVMREAGYAVAPGSLFRIDAPPGIRITVSSLTDDDIEPLCEAIIAAAAPAGSDRTSR